MNLSGMSEEDLAELIVLTIKAAIAPLVKRIGDLEVGVKDLEARPRGLKYCGTWNAAEGPYAVGDVTTDKGSMWVCTKQTRMRPGETPDWQLAVKAGRDAR